RNRPNQPTDTTEEPKTFIEWLSQETGCKSRIKYSDAQYFNLSEKDTRTAKAKRQQSVATIEQIKHVLQVMPNITPIEKRDKALIAFTLLTGARDSAIASMKLKHVDLNADTVYQDAREVNTKFSKSFTTYFFPVGDEERAIVFDWVAYLKNECLFGNDDPLSPKTKISHGEDNDFMASGLTREHWSGAAAIRKTFKGAFALADLPSFNPHSFRNTLASFGETLCRSPEEFKAWSQNFGHAGVLITFYSYGEVQEGRQADIFKHFKEPRKESNHSADEIAEAVLRRMDARR
ncbi:MAG: integrase/recombinase XerD, partial [Lentisphaeria bacterium]